MAKSKMEKMLEEMLVEQKAFREEVRTEMAEIRKVQAAQGADIEALKNEKSASTKGSKKGAAPKMVEFTKANGEVVMCTEAQAKAWSAWKSREHKTLDEVKAMAKPEIPAEVRAYVKANPSCSKKIVDAQFPTLKGMTKAQLSDLKVELGVRTRK